MTVRSLDHLCDNAFGVEACGPWHGQKFTKKHVLALTRNLAVVGVPLGFPAGFDTDRLYNPLP